MHDCLLPFVSLDSFSTRTSIHHEDSMRRRFLFAVVTLSLCLLLSGVVFAQSDLGGISGFVKDPSGAIIPNAKITVRNDSGVERKTSTNENGYYIITNVPPGFYSLTAEAPGFRTFQSKGNKLDPSARLAIDATLSVGAEAQTVEVSGSTVQLQTESSSVQKLVTREQIDALELNGRNPVGLASLVPGARGGTLANANPFLTQGPSNFNGSRNPENLITFDGAPATRTRSNGTSIGSADVDSTQEVQILTANYAPEYGRSSGAQIRVITKSGTQQFHGSAFEYLKNDALNANTWARNANPRTQQVTAPLHYNQFGYNFGGPVYIPGKFNSDKSKFFFFWGQEWIRYHFQESGATRGNNGLLRVPSLKMRQGDFSELLSANPFIKGTTFIKDPLKTGNCTATDQSACFFDPSRATASNPTGLNIIPVNRLSPAGIALLNEWPTPNLTNFIDSANWFAAALHTQHQRKDTLALDYNLTSKQRLTFRRQNYTYLELQPLDGGTDRTPKFFDRPNQTNSLSHVWTISPTKVNELLITGSVDTVRIPVDTAHFFDKTKACAGVTVPCNPNYPYIFNDGKLIPTRIPTVKVSNFNDLNGGPYPSHSSGPIYDLSDSFTWVTGNHTLKFGGLFEHAGENDNDEINVQACATCTNNQNGQFSFTDSRSGGTGVAVANAALGLFDTYSEIGHRAYTIFRGNMWEGFAQDSWKMRQNLTVNVGLRYTVIVPYSAEWRNMIVFDPRFYDPAKAVTISPSTGLIVGTIDPKTGLVVGTGQDLYNGMVIPGKSFPKSALGRVPEADPTKFDFSRLFRGVPDHYSDIQYGQIQPRLGFSYQLNNKTVVRAGGGRFFTRLGVSDSVFLGGNPPFQPNASVTNGSVDNPGGGGTQAVPLVVTTQTKNFRNPEAWNWNFTVERELPFSSIGSLAYVGRRGIHLQREADINQPTIAAVQANPGAKLNAVRPYKGFGSIRQTDNIASSRYNALQATWNRRFTHGLMFGASYTFSKSMDDGSNQRDVVPNTYETKSLWGPSEFDVRHIMILNYLYQLPFFQGQSGFMGKALGGWQISGIAQFQTGTPCSVGLGNDYAGVGLDSNFGCGVTNAQLWVMNGKPKIIGKFGTNGQWFATTNPDGTPIFSAPAPGTFNTQRVRNIIYQPGFWNWNMGLFKTIPVTERVGFQFRAEAFNVFNHPNWGGGSGGGVQFSPTDSNFGKVTSKGGGVGGGERNLQLSLRLQF